MRVVLLLCALFFSALGAAEIIFPDDPKAVLDVKRDLGIDNNGHALCLETSGRLSIWRRQCA